MTFIIFVIILGVLVLVHELGHFLAAKYSEVKVEEFGFGYPPRAISLGRKWGTLFSINWIPFGGFVKIFGENYDNSPPAPSLTLREGEERRFTDVSKKLQALILVAGISFNVLFAWFLFSIGFMIGVPTPADNTFGEEVKNPTLTIIALLPGSPAEKIGLKSGDQIKNIFNQNGDDIGILSPENVSTFINNSTGKVNVEINRGGKELNFDIEPEESITEGKRLIGINMDMIGTLSLRPDKAIIEGAKVTGQLSVLTVRGILNLVADAFRGQADISEVTGPVGIVGLVRDASRLGFAYLITFTALISINLAVINLIPFPALDGGRLLFVLIESITRKPINPKVAQVTNSIGFAILIILMLIVTYRDILKLF